MWDEESISPLRQRLLAARILDLTGEVDGNMAAYVRIALASLMAEGSPAIEVHLTSSGGRLHVGIDIADMFRHYAGKITGKVFFAALSTGGVILQGCDVRLAAPHARIHLHHLSDDTCRYDDLRSRKKSKKILAEQEHSIEQMYDIVLRRTGERMGRKQLRRLCREDRNLSPQEALKLGLIDGIIPDKELK